MVKFAQIGDVVSCSKKQSWRMKWHLGRHRQSATQTVTVSGITSQIRVQFSSVRLHRAQNKELNWGCPLRSMYRQNVSDHMMSCKEVALIHASHGKAPEKFARQAKLGGTTDVIKHTSSKIYSPFSFLPTTPQRRKTATEYSSRLSDPSPRM
jgi:hypothetical protein